MSDRHPISTIWSATRARPRSWSSSGARTTCWSRPARRRSSRPRLAEAPATTARSRSAWSARTPRRRAGTAFVLAGAVAAAAFGIGFLVGDRGSGEFPAQGSPIAMHAPSGAGNDAARASMLVGDRDEVGNWPLLVRVSGLKPLAKGQWYELYLDPEGQADRLVRRLLGQEDRDGRSVRFSVPYDAQAASVGWVVTTGTRRAEPAGAARRPRAALGACGRSRRRPRA